MKSSSRPFPLFWLLHTDDVRIICKTEGRSTDLGYTRLVIAISEVHAASCNLGDCVLKYNTNTAQ